MQIYLDLVSERPDWPLTSYVAEADLELLILLLPVSVWITGMYHHTQCMQYW